MELVLEAVFPFFSLVLGDDQHCSLVPTNGGEEVSCCTESKEIYHLIILWNHLNFSYNQY